MYELTKAIEECINDCIKNDSAEIIREDEKGNRILYLSAEWIALPEHNYKKKAVQICFHFNDTGRIAYGTVLKDTICNC